jgi:hypothetical protein
MTEFENQKQKLNYLLIVSITAGGRTNKMQGEF